MLKHNKNRLHGRVRGDISATLLIAQHAEFEVIDMIRHERCELIDLLVGDEEIAFGLEERETESVSKRRACPAGIYCRMRRCCFCLVSVGRACWPELRLLLFLMATFDVFA